MLFIAAGAERAAAQSPPPSHPVTRVPVAARPLARGAVLGAGDIVYRDSVINIPTDTSRVTEGWVTRRVIAAGEVLRPPAVTLRNVVLANQAVDIEYADKDVSLTLRGTATRSAPLGERIVVRTEFGRRVEGTVVGPGRVRLD